uniref:Uncharacterized protein n=1 Tax=Mola mola TaxID=94237 RepID=A0A3Q3WLS1_MOLML
MRQMMRSFSEPFGGPLMPTIMDGRPRSCDMEGHTSSSRDLMTNPFSLVDNMMANVRNRMQEMHRNIENMSTDSHSHSFSSSSVMTYSKVGNEPPKVFQASSSTLRAPGGIKETRRAVKDSESGLERMAIGHHIQDKGHVVEKKYNKKTGEKELNQNFQNMDESEAQAFEDEWQKKLSHFQPSDHMPGLEEPQRRDVHRPAIASSEEAHWLVSRGKDEPEPQVQAQMTSRC